MESILVIVHLFLAIGLVGLILIQHGKGADMGAAFGSGASATVFGSRGASNFLSRSTAVLAALFFATSLALAFFAMQSREPETLMEAAPPAAVETAPPAVPGAVDLPTVPEVPSVLEVPSVPAEAEIPKVAD
jgi:preprotein translocase subunit SecG